jgi:tetratricopeptide (TPR) repeat protein
MQSRPVLSSSTRPKPKEPGKDAALPLLAPQTLAEEYFVKGSALDMDESRHGAAATWYRKALEIDPYLVPAIINLANIHYGQGRTGGSAGVIRAGDRTRPRVFRGALQPRQHLPRPRPLSGSGGVLPHGAPSERQLRRRALLSGHYLEKTGHSAEAKPHWRSYQLLSPNGEWVELAREFSE